MTIESQVNEPEHPTAATKFPKKQNEGSISRCFSNVQNIFLLIALE